MIHVDRATVPRPSWYGSRSWADELDRLVHYLATFHVSKTQRRSTSVLGQWPREVETAVQEVFSSRCAMCESPVGSLKSAATRFRPLECEDSKDRYRFAYAALLWENLVTLCYDCHRARGNRFPIMAKGVNRSAFRDIVSRLRSDKAGTTYKELAAFLERAHQAEAPLQIDPTREDPFRFFAFDEKAWIVPRRVLSGGEVRRAEHTIDVFRLNRPTLVQQRRKASSAMLKFLSTPVVPKKLAPGRASMSAMQKFRDSLPQVVEFLLQDFPSIKASVFVDWFKDHFPIPLPDLLTKVDWSETELAKARGILIPVWTSKVHSAGRLTKPKSPSVPAHKKPAVAETSYQLFSSARVTKVRLTNFRHFSDATFQLPIIRPDDSFGPNRELTRQIRSYSQTAGSLAADPENFCGWKMILGENGVGKSSILQAIAIALVADQKGKEAVPGVSELHYSISPEADRASIQVWLDDRTKPLHVEIGKAPTAKGIFGKTRLSVRGSHYSSKDTTSSDPLQLYLRAYGATRLLPPSPTPDPSHHTKHSKPNDVGNLFDPYFPLANPNHWLQGLEKEDRRLAFIALKDLLDLPKSSQLRFSKLDGANSLHLVHRRRTVPLSHLSAGYQSIVALACDIMAGFGPSLGDMINRTGVVLLDEIGTNLHPRWRLRIVHALRRTFPQIQFIASTHEPLCLRGLGKDEVALLQIGEDQNVSLRDDDLPSPGTFRVDQLLTGDFFGLETAYDPDEEAAFDVYHKLLVDQRAALSGGRPLTRKQKDLLSQLHELLKNRLNLGDTAAERRLLSALEIAEAEVAQEVGMKEPLKGSTEAKDAADRLLQRLTPSPLGT
jgi:hypothetical protein